MEIHPDFDAGEVARTVALAVSNLHNRTQSSDSGTDDTPLLRNRGEKMSINADTEDKASLVPTDQSRWSRICSHLPARYVLTILGFLGFCNVYALRVNLSVALVAMVNQTAIASLSNRSIVEECGRGDSSNVTDSTAKQGEFNWSPDTQSNILGAFFYGYLLTQIPGGRLAEVVGGKWLYGVGILCTSILTLLTPVAAKWGVGALITLRVLEGIGEGVTFPAMHAMLGAWLPKFERSMLCTIIYSGAQIGTVISMPISGFLCGSDFLGGWPSVFYVFGTLGCLWFIFWALLIYEKPDQHPRISKAELILIKQDQEDNKGAAVPPIPWRQILASVPVWTLMITHFGQNWGFYTFLTELPTYLGNVLHFNIRQNGITSALPYLMQAIVSWITSYAADKVRKSQRFTISTIRKVCNSIGFFGSAICLAGVIFAGCNWFWSVVFLTLAMGINGFTYSGYMITHVDMSPVFAGTLMGMTNGFATLAGFLAPKAVGVLTENNETLAQWRIVFIIAIVIYFLTGTLFIFCGSAQLQNWSSPGPDSMHSLGTTHKNSDTDDK